MRGVWRMVCGTWHVVTVTSPTKRQITLWNIQYCEVGDHILSRKNPGVGTAAWATSAAAAAATTAAVAAVAASATATSRC